MQLLYGNDGNNYRTLARTSEMDEFVEKGLKEAYLFYKFVENDSAYSSVKTQPVSLTYVTTNLGGALKKEQVLLCKNARMTNFSTPSSYAHFQLLDPLVEGYGRNFFRYFRYGFISDMGAVKCSDDALESFQPGIEPKAKGRGVAQEILKAVVGLILARDRSSFQLRVILDEAGDEYNQRSLEFLEAVYHCLPCDLRKRHGFCTYAAPNQNVAARVKLIVMEPSCVPERLPDYLDIADIVRATEIFGQLPVKIQSFVNYLFQLEEEEREDYLESIYQGIGGEILSAEDYVDLHQSTDRWETAPLDDVFVEWVAYARQNVETKSPVYGVFKKVVAKRLDNTTFNKYIMGCLSKQKAGSGAAGWNQELVGLIDFCEQFPHLSLLEETFSAWEQEQVFKNLSEKYTGEDLIEALQAEQQAILDLDIPGMKFTPVRSELVKILQEEAKKERDRIEHAIEKEEKKSRYYLSVESVKEAGRLKDMAEKLLSVLKYPERTRQIVGKTWAESFKKFLEQHGELKTEEEYQYFQAQLPMQQLISKEELQELKEMLEDKRRVLDGCSLLANITIEDKMADKAKEQLTQLESLEQEGYQVPQKMILKREGSAHSFSIGKEELLRLLCFIEKPSRDTYEGAAGILKGRDTLLWDMVGASCVTMAELEPLDIESEMSVRLILHCLKDTKVPMNTSEEELIAGWLARILKHYDGKKRKELISGLEKGNDRMVSAADQIRRINKDEKESAKNHDASREQEATADERKRSFKPGTAIFAYTGVMFVLFLTLFLMNIFWFPQIMEVSYTIAIYVLDILFLMSATAVVYFCS